jgi:hypothetical protein
MKNSVKILYYLICDNLKKINFNSLTEISFYIPILILLVVLSLTNCGGNASSKIDSGVSEVVVCDFSKVRDTIYVPLSSLVESCDIVILENKPEALIGNAWHTAISDDYIAVKSHESVPVRLFSKDGKYLRDIGAIGRGPGEYSSLYGLQFSPVGDMLYLLPFGTTDNILVYDLDGNHLNDIPLAYTQRKFKAKFSTDSVITIFSMPFKNDPAICYQQDYSGKVIQEVTSPEYLINSSFDGELFSNLNYFNDFFNTATDTLYNYDTENNRLVPRFTKDFGDLKTISWSSEIPGYFYFYFYTYPDREYSGNILVDKMTLESHYFSIVNDFIGGVRMSNSFSNDMFIDNISAFALKQRIDVALENNDLDESMRKKLIEFDNRLDDADNNVIFYGKLKR